MPLAWAVGKLGGRHAAEAAVRTYGVVIRPPCFDNPSGCSERGEHHRAADAIAGFECRHALAVFDENAEFSGRVGDLHLFECLQKLRLHMY